MRESMKKRLAVFLALIMILPAIMAVLPMTSTEVQAASVSMYWNVTGNGSQTIQVEKGQKFYVGDYVSIYINGVYNTASMVKASYSTSKKSVATVNSKGYFTAKSKGTTTISVKYKGKKTTCKFQVVPAGSFKSSKAVSTVKSKASALAKSIPSKVTTKNGFDLLKKAKDYNAAITGNINITQEISMRGFLKEEKKNQSTYTYDGKTYTTTYTSYVETTKLAVPQAGRDYTLSYMLSVYADKNSPTSTRSAKGMKIASVSAKASAITIKLKKSIGGTEQILGAQIDSRYQTALKNSGKTKAQISVSMQNTKTNEWFYGVGTLQKGSKTLKLVPKEYTSVKEGSSYVTKYITTKLKKGTYRLGSKNEWTKGKTITIK